MDDYPTNEQYRKMSTQIRDLQEELAKQKKENAKLKEQLRVKGAGVPFQLTPSQLAAFAD